MNRWDDYGKRASEVLRRHGWPDTAENVNAVIEYADENGWGILEDDHGWGLPFELERELSRGGMWVESPRFVEDPPAPAGPRVDDRPYDEPELF